MRLLRLDLGESRQAIDLHPFVTIVRDLGGDERQTLLDALRSLARGSTAGIRGLVQHEGLLVELDGYGDDRVSAATESPVVVDLGAADDDDLAALRAQIESLHRRVEVDSALVEEIRADLDLSAAYAVDQLQRRLTPRDPAAEERRRVLLDTLKLAIAAVADIDPIVREAPPGVVALAGRCRAHAAKGEGADAHVAALEARVAEARQRCSEAEHTLAEAEAATKPVFLSREEEARLEALAFPGMDDSRRGRWKNKLREEEEVEMQALLDKVGVDSWTAYTMYRVSPSVPEDRLQAATWARNTAEEARAELAAAEQALEHDGLVAELSVEHEAIKAEARHYLGMMLPSDIGAALTALVVEKPNPEWESAVERLCGELDAAEIVVADSSTPAGIVDGARAWVAAEEAPDDEIDRDELERHLADARARLVKHERALARIGRAEAAAMASKRRVAQTEEQLQVRAAGGPATAAALLDLLEPVIAQLDREALGSRPLAVIADFQNLAEEDVAVILDRLDEVADRLQILVLTGHEAAVSWAKRAGLERAFISGPKAVTLGEAA